MAPTIAIPTPSNLTQPTTTSLPHATHAALLSHLQSTHSITPLSDLLADSLARTGWTDRARVLALDLLRSGACNTFPQLLAEVLRRATLPQPQPQKPLANGTSDGAGQTKTNGNGNGNGMMNGADGSDAAVEGGSSGPAVNPWNAGPDGMPDVRIPQTTVDVGVQFLRERIKDAVEVMPDEDEDEEERS